MSAAEPVDVVLDCERVLPTGQFCGRPASYAWVCTGCRTVTLVCIPCHIVGFRTADRSCPICAAQGRTAPTPTEFQLIKKATP